MYRYSFWDGSQDPFELTHEEVMNEISDDLMAHGDVQRALRRLMQRGMRTQQGDRQRNMMGLRDMARKLREQRQQHLDRYDLNSIMNDLKEKLREVIDIEKQGLERRQGEAHKDPPADGQRPGQGQQQPLSPEDTAPSDSTAQDNSSQDLDEFLKEIEDRIRQEAQQKGKGSQAAQQGQGQKAQPGQGQQGQQSKAGQQGQSGSPEDLSKLLENILSKKMDFMNTLPEDMGGAIQALSDYDFMEDDARAKFQELLDMLRERARTSLFNNLNQQIKNMSPQQMQANKEFLRDLNDMLQEKMDGGEPNFQEFMDKWGPLFGDSPPENLDELMDMLMHQMAQMQSLMDSLPPNMRDELMQAMNQALQDPEIREEMARLSALMDYMYPMDDLRQQYPFSGDEQLSFSEAMRLMEELQRLDEMERDIRAADRQGNLDMIDQDRLEQLLGEDARRDLEQLKEIQKRLEEAGYVRQNGDKLELTPKGIRKIGQNALKDIFDKLKHDRLGLHDMRKQGLFGEMLEDDTKAYEYGDHFHLNMVKTVKNSLLRNGPGTPLKLKPDDFEVLRQDNTTQAATVILLDQSRSMAISGCFDAAKKVSLAFHSLIKSQYPRDNLYIVGFADFAWELKEEQLLHASWGGYSPGTNMQHALQLARSLLSKHRIGTRQVIMITDGEPTAHLEGGVPFFSYPPSQETIEETLKEVRRCTQEGIVINVFMLEMAYYLVHFVRQMTQINRGRAFFTTPDKLGEYMLVDYLSNKRRAIK